MHLLELKNRDDVEFLFSKSREIKESLYGKDVLVKGVIKFSNYCTETCMYCVLREENLSCTRYRLSSDEILCCARKIYERGVKTIFLRSGQDDYFDTDVISFIIYSIKKEFDVAVTLNLGQRSFDEYKSWKIAGADRYFLKNETANPNLYSQYYSKSEFEEKINHIKFLKQIGYQIGTGMIIGLPKQELRDIAEHILLCKELDIDMLSVGPFIPMQFTPYHNQKEGDLLLTLKTVAVARLVNQNISITATAALDCLDDNGREKGLYAGANVVFTNFTPFPYSEMYQAHSNRTGIPDNHEMIKDRIESTGSSFR